MISVKRSRLLAAGEVIAKKSTLAQLTADAVADQARLNGDHFAAEFASMDDYLVELQREFLQGILNAMVAEIDDIPPSLDRMTRAMEIQLDRRLQQRGLRRLLIEARRRVPLVAETFHKQSQVTALMMGIELRALGCPNPAEIGRLYWTLILEAAQIEAEQGVALPVVRKALRDFLAVSVAAKARR